MSDTANIVTETEVPIWPVFVIHVLRVLSTGETLHRRDIVSSAIDSAGPFVTELMSARRAVKEAKRAEDAQALKSARARVNDAKVALGERGPVWWDDGSPDYNRFKVSNTPYAQWFAQLPEEDSSSA